VFASGLRRTGSSVFPPQTLRHAGCSPLGPPRHPAAVVTRRSAPTWLERPLRHASAPLADCLVASAAACRAHARRRSKPSLTGPARPLQPRPPCPRVWRPLTGPRPLRRRRAGCALQPSGERARPPPPRSKVARSLQRPAWPRPHDALRVGLSRGHRRRLASRIPALRQECKSDKWDRWIDAAADGMPAPNSPPLFPQRSARPLPALLFPQRWHARCRALRARRGAAPGDGRACGSPPAMALARRARFSALSPHKKARGLEQKKLLQKRPHRWGRIWTRHDPALMLALLRGNYPISPSHCNRRLRLVGGRKSL